MKTIITILILAFVVVCCEEPQNTQETIFQQRLEQGLIPIEEETPEEINQPTNYQIEYYKLTNAIETYIKKEQEIQSLKQQNIEELVTKLKEIKGE